jgi:hypothetical protein
VEIIRPADEEENTINAEARIVAIPQTDQAEAIRMVVNSRETDFSAHQQNLAALKKTKGLKI